MNTSKNQPCIKLDGKRPAVMSDIHSGYNAFKACFDDAVKNGCDSFIFLGDYISDLAEVQKTMELLYEIRKSYPCVCLRGNRERYILSTESGIGSFEKGSQTGSLLFTYERLSKRDMEFFAELNFYDVVEIGKVRFELAHSSPTNDRYYFDDKDGRISEIFPQMTCKYLLTGHSHRQYICRDGDKTIINPGAVGIPKFTSTLSPYAILDVCDGEADCTLRRVEYDLGATIHSQFASGLVDYAKYWAVGILYDIINGNDGILTLLKNVEARDGLRNEEVWHSEAECLGMKFTEREIYEFWKSREPLKNER